MIPPPVRLAEDGSEDPWTGRSRGGRAVAVRVGRLLRLERWPADVAVEFEDPLDAEMIWLNQAPSSALAGLMLAIAMMTAANATQRSPRHARVPKILRNMGWPWLGRDSGPGKGTPAGGAAPQ